ncbi:hypothetical protein D4R89_02785 [bacterium]|nr:MAG: hypothetical protein D4R89_02785 [bacterium]
MTWKTFDFKSRSAGKIGEVLDKNIYRCGFCAGRGSSPSKKNTKCPVCLGAGTIRIQPPAVICAYCKGSGKSHINSALTCSVCSGRGVTDLPSRNIEACPSCRGRGRGKGESLPCLICRGKGVVAKKE